jgi:uncharacterized protein (TIRG00374 family)
MTRSVRPTHGLIALAILGLFLFGLVASFLVNISKLPSVLDHLKISALIFALICTTLAYISIALSFSGLFELIKTTIPFPRLFSITFISSTFNYIVSSAGLSSLAVRAFLFKQAKISYSFGISISIAQGMLTNFVLLILCLSGGVYLLEWKKIYTGWGIDLVGVLIVGLGIMVLFFALGFLSTVFRHKVLNYSFKIWDWVWIRWFRKKSRNSIWSRMLHNFDESIQLLHQGWLQLGITLFWVIMDWTFTVLVFYFCFRAVNIALPFGFLLVGFSIQFLLSNLNIVPGGIGIAESAVTGLFYTLGLHIDQVLIAILLFRVVYYLIPMAVAFTLYLDTIRNIFYNKAISRKE